MRIATFILGLLLTIVMFLQSCAVYVLGSMSDSMSKAAPTERTAVTGAGGILVTIVTAIAMAFTLGLPRVAAVLYLLGAGIAYIASKTFPDMGIYAVLLLILAVMAFFSRRKSRSAQSESSPPSAQYPI